MVRIAIYTSISSFAKSNLPTAPAYTPLLSFSSSAISSIALILGAPETVPAGKIDRKASNLVSDAKQEKRYETRGHLGNLEKMYRVFPSRSCPVTWLVR